MKKTLLISCIILFSLNFSQAQVNFKSSARYVKLGSQFAIQDTVYRSLDNMNRPIEEYTKSWDDESESLVFDTKRTYTYRADFEEPTIVVSRFDKESKSFATRYKYEPVLDIQGKILSNETKRWNNQSKSFEKENKYIYNYNENKDILEEMSYEWIDSAFVLVSKIQYEYDAAKNLVKESNYEWDEEKKVFIPNYKFEYMYENKLLKKKIQYNWSEDKSDFVLFSNRIYSYDKKDNLVSEVFQLYKNGQFLNKKESRYLWDDEKKLLGETFLQFDETQGLFFVVTNVFYYY